MSDTAAEAPVPAEGGVQDQAPDQSGAPQEGTSATPEAPEHFSEGFDPSTLDEPLQERYRQMQADYTRKTQDLAEQRKQAEGATALVDALQSGDPQQQQHALAWMAQEGLLTPEQTAEVFGWEITNPDDETEPLDPDTPMTRAEFEAWQADQAAQQQQAAQQAAQQQWAESEDQRVNAELDELGGGKLSKVERDQIFYSALGAAQAGLTQGLDIKRAHGEYESVWTDRQKAWRDGKQTVQPTAAGGLTATEAPDMNTHEARVAWMLEQANAGLNSQ